MNKAILMGRLTKDPEVRYSQAAEPVAIARYTLAVNRRFKKDGEPDADFIPCVAFGRVAEFTERYLKKGMMIAVSGRIQVRSWEDQSGQKRWSTEVIVEEQDFAESRASFEGRSSENRNYEGRSSSDNREGRSGENRSNDRSGGGSYYSQNSSASPAREPEGFSAITESIEDEDLPF